MVRPAVLKCSIKSHNCRRLRIQTGRWLVEEENIGVADDRAGDCQSLFLPAGEIPNARPRFFIELHHANHLGNAWSTTIEATKEANGLFNGQFFGKLRILKLNPKTMTKFRAVRVPAQTKQFDRTAVRREQPLANLNGRGLPRSVWSEDAKTFARRSFEIDAINRNDVTVALAQTLYAQRRRQRHRSSVLFPKPGTRKSWRPVDDSPGECPELGQTSPVSSRWLPGKPSGLNLWRAFPTEAGVLNDVLGIADVAEHAISE